MQYEIQIYTAQKDLQMPVVSVIIDRPTTTETIFCLLQILEKNYEYLRIRLGFNRYKPGVRVFDYVGKHHLPDDDFIKQAALDFLSEKYLAVTPREYTANIYIPRIGEDPPRTEASVSVRSAPESAISDLKQAINNEYDYIYKHLDLKNNLPVIHIIQRFPNGTACYADESIRDAIRKFLIEKYVEKTQEEISNGQNNI